MIQFAGRFFNAIPLSVEMWAKIILCASLIVVLNEVIKELLRLLKHSAKSAVRTVGGMRKGA